MRGRGPGDLRVVDPETPAERVPREATALVSGVESVGYPEAVPEALADGGRNLSLTVASGGVGPGVDAALVEPDAVDRR